LSKDEVVAEISLVDFAAITETSAIVSIEHHSPNHELPNGKKLELIGTEKQTITLMLSVADGSPVQFDRRQGAGWHLSHTLLS
jgi:hypothetical protein